MEIARPRQPADRGRVSMRALVTGAAGFIGSHLVDRLLADGHQVIGMDNFTTGHETNLGPALGRNSQSRQPFTLVRADLGSPELVDIVAGAAPHVIFHLAAQVNNVAAITDPQFDARSNVLGTINLCEASRQAGVKRIVYAASGVSRYGSATRLVDEEAEIDPPSPNAAGKVASELYLRAYAQMYGLAPISLALANVYGPRQETRGIAGEIVVLASAMITGNPYTLLRAAAIAHDYVYVDDAVDAFIRAGFASIETTGTYNIGSGLPATASEVYAHIVAALDGLTTPSLAEAASGELGALALNSSKASDELDWRPKYDLAEGIRRTVHWLCGILEPESSSRAG